MQESHGFFVFEKESAFNKSGDGFFQAITHIDGTTALLGNRIVVFGFPIEESRLAKMSQGIIEKMAGTF